jgi:hypothetical protein
MMEKRCNKRVLILHCKPWTLRALEASLEVLTPFVIVVYSEMLVC